MKQLRERCASSLGRYRLCERRREVHRGVLGFKCALFFFLHPLSLTTLYLTYTSLGQCLRFYHEPQERRPRNNRREWEHKNVDHGTAEQQQQQQNTFHKSGTLEICFEVRQDYNLLLLSLFFTGLFGQMKTWLWKLRLLLVLFFFCDGKLLGQSRRWVHAGGHSVFISSNVPFLQSGRIYQSLALWGENTRSNPRGNKMWRQGGPQRGTWWHKPSSGAR